MRLLGLFFAAEMLFGQALINPESRVGKAAAAALDAAPGGSSLSCQVEPLRPLLTVALRFQAGYRTSFPLSKLPQKNATLLAVFRVISEQTGKSYLFRQIFRFPEIPPGIKQDGTLDGGLFLGKGDYNVKWLLTDLNGQECRKEWRIRLNIKDKDTRLSSRMEPGEVASLRLNTWLQRSRRERPFRVAILVHGSPVYPRASVLSSYDISLYLTTVASLLEDTPFAESSVVAFNLQQRKEIFRSERMERADFLRLFDSLDELEVATVDLKNMMDRTGYVRMLTGLVNRENAAAQPPDAVIFLGPNTRYDAKIPEGLLENGSQTKFYYLKYGYFGRFLPFPDSIERLVKSQDGRVFRISNPRDFAAALRRIEQDLGERR